MNPNNPTQPVVPPPAPAQPIQDVVPAPNPIAGTAAPQSSIIHEQPANDHALDSVLANVSNNIKTPPPPAPVKKGFFGGSKKPKQPPTNPLAQPLAPGPTKTKAKKPIMPIALAALAGIGLAAAAFLAYK